MTKDEALRMALEALENHSGNYKLTKDECVKYRAIEDAIKEALKQEKALQALHDENERLGLYKDAYAQPEHKKYCPLCQGAGQVDTGINESPVTVCNACNGTGLKAQTEQRSVSEQQKPVAWLYERKDSITNVHLEQVEGAVDRGWTETPLYTTPPQRKPLTDEQKVALCKQFPDHLTFNAIHAIEAAHGIKE